jgi:hypothetical protein
MKHQGATQEKAVGCVLAGGVVLCVVAGILIWVFSVAGVYRGTYTRTPITNEITDPGTLNLVPLCILLLAVGVLMVGGAIGYGLLHTSKARAGVRRVEPYLRVLARYGYDGGHMIHDFYEFEAADKPRYYVKAVTQHGVVHEFETTPEVFGQAGEGMVGEGEIQGQWLGRFVPYIGEPAAPNVLP